MMNAETVIDHTRRWVSDVVIGLNLCPFARRVFDGGLIRFLVTGATTTEELREALKVELQALAGTPAEEVETVILIHPRVLTDFLDYNDFLAEADALLAELDLGDIVGARDVIRGKADSISGVKVVDASTIQINIDAIEGVIPCEAEENAPDAKSLIITSSAKFIGTLTPWSSNTVANCLLLESFLRTLSSSGQPSCSINPRNSSDFSSRSSSKRCSSRASSTWNTGSVNMRIVMSIRRISDSGNSLDNIWNKPKVSATSFLQ